MTTTTYTTGDTPPSTLTVASGDTVIFEDAASAGMSQITNAGLVEFENASTAGSATITTINGGKTTFAGNSTAGSAALVASSGGVVDFSATTGVQGDGKVSAGSLAGAGTFDLGADQLTVGSDGTNTTVAGVIADGGQAGGTGGSLVKTGVGTLTLTGSNTFSGGIDVIGGVLSVSKDASLGAATGVVTLDGGTLSTVASNGFSSVKLNHAIVLGTHGGTLTGATYPILGLAGAINGSGGLTIGSGRVVLLGNNSYSGGTTIDAGAALYLGSNNAGGGYRTPYGTVTSTLIGSITNNSGLLVLNADLSGVPSIATTDGATTVIAQALPPSLALTTTSGAEVDVYETGLNVPSTYTLPFNGPGTYVLEPNVSVVIAASTDGTPVDAKIVDAGGGVIKQGMGTTIFAGGSLSAGLVIRSGVVQLGTTTEGTLSGTPDMSETTSSAFDNFAELDVVATSSVGGSFVSEAGGRTNFYNGTDAANANLYVLGTGIIDFSRTLGPAADGVVQASQLMGDGTVYLGSDQLELDGGGGGAFNFSGTLSDGGAAGGTGGSVRLDTYAHVTFSGVNSYSGGTFIHGGTLSVASDASLGAVSGAVTFDGGTLDITSASFSSSRAFVLNAGGGTVDYDFSGTVTIAGISGVGALTKTGAATAILGSATYTGGTTNAEGLMEVGTTASGGLSGTGGVTALFAGAVVNDGTLDIVNADTSQLTSLTDNSRSGINFFNKTSAGNAVATFGGFYQGYGTVNFYDYSSAGKSNISTTEDISFHDHASSGQSNITISGAISDANLSFLDSSDAGYSTIIQHGFDQHIIFAGNSSAANASITNFGDALVFRDRSTAGDSTIDTESNYNYYFEFDDNSSGGSATLIARNGGVISFNGSGPDGDNSNSAGSLSSDKKSIIAINSTRLMVGSDNKSTVLAGVTEGSGSLVKVGTGTLTFAYAGSINSLYSGGTTIENGTIDLATAAGAGTGTITFAGSAGSVATLALEFAAQPSDTGTFSNTIDDFGLYDVLDLKGLTYTLGATATRVGNTLIVISDAKTENFTLGGAEAPAYSVSRGMDGEAVVTAACYAAGTLISTTHGAIAIENLRVGDLVMTASGGGSRPIRWLGHRTLDGRHHPRPVDVLPVRIAAHAFGDDRPSRDLFVSPGHSICVDVVGEVLIPADALINGTTITRADVEIVTYWHVELDDHDVILAENLPSESYLEMGNRGFFVEGSVVSLAATPDARLARTHADFSRPFHHGGALVSIGEPRVRFLQGLRKSSEGSVAGL